MSPDSQTLNRQIRFYKPAVKLVKTGSDHAQVGNAHAEEQAGYTRSANTPVSRCDHIRGSGAYGQSWKVEG